MNRGAWQANNPWDHKELDRSEQINTTVADSPCCMTF